MSPLLYPAARGNFTRNRRLFHLKQRCKESTKVVPLQMYNAIYMVLNSFKFANEENEEIRIYMSLPHD